jgi:predicted MFS family arabinose efflux permease
LLAVALGVLTLIWQLLTLPRMAPSGETRLRTLVDVLQRRGVGLGMITCILVFTGHFAFFTYLRPFLEGVTGVGVNGLSAILLGFGVANFVGTFLAGFFLERNLRPTLLLMPLLMSLIGFSLVALGPALLPHAALVSLWGLAFGAVPVAWTTWITRTVPDEAESGNGLIVAAVQLAITLGAAAGGAVFDVTGAKGVFTASAMVLLTATLIISLGFRARTVLATP